MSLKMPELDQAVLARRAEIVAALRAIVPGEGVVAAEPAMKPFESDGLTAYRQIAHGGGIARDHRAGRGCVALLQRRGNQSCAARRRHLALRRRTPARRWRAARHVQVQPHPRNRFRQPRGGR